MDKYLSPSANVDLLKKVRSTGLCRWIKIQALHLVSVAQELGRESSSEDNKLSLMAQIHRLGLDNLKEAHAKEMMAFKNKVTELDESEKNVRTKKAKLK